MAPFLFYILRSGLYLSLFYAFYLLVMRRTTFFRLNRALLLGGSYLCLLLPLVRVRSAASASVAAGALTIVGVGAGQEAPAAAAFPWARVLLAVYLLGGLVTLALYLVSAWKMRRLIASGVATEREGCRLVVLDRETPSFSWRRSVVMSRKDLEENPAIFAHERMHVQCRHSLDLLLFLPLQLLFWWNPLVWITREELRLVHEYEADEGVIQQGIDVTQYQLLLVRKAVGEHRFTLASGFQHAKLKNRITMMLKSNSSRWMRWSYLAMIPVLALLMYSCNPSRKTQEPAVSIDNNGDMTTIQVKSDDLAQEAVPFSAIEVKPTFNGGDANEFSKWVNAQLTYPEQAKNDGIQGRVMIQFTIGADGAVRDAQVVRGVREDLDAEALKVINASPKWTPGQQNGKAVPVTFTFPIVFQLR